MPATIPPKPVAPPPANGKAYTVDEAIAILNDEIWWLVGRMEKGVLIILDREKRGLGTTKQQAEFDRLNDRYKKLCDQRRDLGYPGEMSYVSTIAS